MYLKLEFQSANREQEFSKLTGEVDLENVNLGLINFALAFDGIKTVEAVGDAVSFNVKSNGKWSTEMVADPVARIKAGDILEPDTKIKMLSEMDVAPTVTPWAINRIANRYAPFVSNPYFAELDPQRDVEVIIMDSGILKTHEELQGVNIEDLYFVPAFANTNDDLGHGTAIAGLIAGKTTGVNTHAKLKIVKVSSGTYTPTLGELADAFDFVINYHANSPSVPKVLNLSWRIPASTYINEKITALINAGVTVVAAAGNTALDIDTITPAGCAGVFTVAASSMTDKELYAVFGTNKKLNLYAPGESVNVPLITADDAYGSSTGSSFSAALVSGVASMLFGLRATAPLSSDVTGAMVSDSTYNALIVNDNVSQTENRLLHRPDTNSLPADNVQYLGTNTLGGTADMKIDIKMLMPVSVMADAVSPDTTFTLQYGDASMEALMNRSTISSAGVANVKITPGATLGPGEKVRQIWFTVTMTRPGITFVSPKIYFFLCTPDAVSSDIKPLLDVLSASSSFTFLEEVDQESVQSKGIKS